MSGNTTQNTSALIKGEVFSEMLLEILQDPYFLATGLYRDVSDFGDGEKLVIPTIGEGVLHDYAEDTPVKYDPIDTGRVYLEIDQYKQTGTYVLDKLKQDSYQTAQLESRIPEIQARLIKVAFETNLLSKVNLQTLNDPNSINGAAHRWVAASGSTQGVLTLDDLAYAKFALDKANAPEEGRIFILDPIAELSFNAAVAGQAFTNNPQFQGIAETGFAKNARFLRNIFGFDVYVNHRLPQVASETINGGPHASSKSVTDGVVNIFGCFGDDMTTPFMGAWRQSPRIEGERNKDYQRDEYITTARWGFGLQRRDTLGAVITSRAVYK